jgi:hypothetical protein
MKLTLPLTSRMILGLACVIPVALSCGGSPPPSAESAATGGASAPASEVAWKDQNADQRKQFMKTVVYPKMKAEFVTFDAKDFSNMTCATCHGDGAKDGSFKMPNPGLPKLPGDEAGFKELAAKKPEAVKFMHGTVVPEMAQMLGEKPYDPTTHEGFGCFQCHTK